MRNNILFAAIALLITATAWAQDPASIGSISYNNTLGAYEINCADNLHDLAVYVNGAGDYTTSGSETTAHNCEGLTFKMTADIDIPHTTEWNVASTETNYTAIGTSDNWFSGTFDGQHHTVSGIRIYYIDTKVLRLGLFGVIRGGSTVQNVNISSIRIRGYNSIGAVVGLAWPNSTVSGCSVTDAFIAGGNSSYGYLGGVVGCASGGSAGPSAVSDCHVSATVTIHATTTSNRHGGIAGSVSDGSITGCTSSATLTIADAVGGCKYFGGIVGYSGSSAIQNCRAVGVTVPATTEDSYGTSGAIIGSIPNTGSTPRTDNYYLNCTIAGTPNAVQIGIGHNASSTSDHTSGTHSLHSATLENGMFVSGTNIIIGSDTYYPSGKTMTLTGGTGYTVTVDGSNPVTYVQVTETSGVYTFTMPSGNITVSGAPDYAGLWHADSDHDGSTEEKAYIITTPAGLNLLASLVNNGNTYSGTYFKLGADITYTHTTDWDDAGSTENNFVPIGNASDGNNTKFSGIFNGCDHTVSGIRIYYPTDSNLGLFGSILSATVKNVWVTDARITGKNNMGGIAGTSQSSDVENCHVSATVALHAKVDDSQSHGGIVGLNWKYSSSVNNSRVLNCTSSVRLTKTGNLSNCGLWGGIVGSNNGAGAVVTNCFATGVFVDDWGLAGAVAGSNEEVFGSTSGTLSNNYYNECAVTDHTSGIGLGISGNAQDVTDNDGARGVGRITTDGSVIITGTKRTISSVDWYLAGQSITLGHGAAPMGYSFGGYTVTRDGTNPAETEDIAENAGVYTFTMPTRNVTASLTWTENASLDIAATAATLFGESSFVTTFYHGVLDYELPSGSRVYTASLDGTNVVFHLIGDDGSVIPHGNAAIVVADADNITLTKLVSTAVTPYDGNILLGSDTDVTVTAGKVAGKTPYVLNISGGVLGFYKFTGDTIPAGKAYYLKSE